MEDNMTDKKDNNTKLKGLFMGGILVGIGLLFLADNLFYGLDMEILWPSFILVPATILLAVWLQNKKKYAVLLFPVTTLVFFFIYFMWLNLTSWYNVELTWPNFLIGPGLGFLVVFFFKKQWSYIIPALTLLILAGIFYSEMFDTTLIFSLALIAVGTFLIIKPKLLVKNTRGNT